MWGLESDRDWGGEFGAEDDSPLVCLALFLSKRCSTEWGRKERGQQPFVKVVEVQTCELAQLDVSVRRASRKEKMGRESDSVQGRGLEPYKSRQRTCQPERLLGEEGQLRIPRGTHKSAVRCGVPQSHDQPH